MTRGLTQPGFDFSAIAVSVMFSMRIPMHLERGDCLEVSTAVFLLAATCQVTLAPVQARLSGRLITLG